jgi:hypothetical protein
MQKTIVTKIDDLTGKEYDEGETVTFAFQGKSYEIDLSKRNATDFHKKMARYMEKGRKVTAHRVTSSRDGRKVKHDRNYVHTVRAWAQANGMEVSNRGRVPLSVYEAYEKANG